MFSKRVGLLMAVLFVLVVVLAACQPETVEVVKEIPVEVTRVVTETITEEGQEMEVTRVVSEQIVVTATPEPMAPVSFAPPDPDTYVSLTFGDVDTLDPNLAYDSASGQVLQNVMEGLVYFNRGDSNTVVAALAEEVPTKENGLISEDGMTYTFNIREGISFHEGGTLEPHDVAYTFQRGLLQSDPNGPQWLLLEPILGFSNCYDITEGLDPECGMAGDIEALVATAPEDLAAVCEQVQAAIVADDDAGTVTFNLNQPWGPFLVTLAGYWGNILDSEWAIENGAWDGDCATWQNHYAPGSENSELTPIINGTGPYMLDHWTPGEEYQLVANPNYWRGEDMPVWEGGPSGEPRIKNVLVRIVNEWGTRFASLQAGDAASVAIPQENETQVDPFIGEFCDYVTGECTPNPDNPEGALRKWDLLPSVARTDVFLNYDVATDESGGNPYIGSGQLDGQGVPPDFFSDIHVRRAFNYCFDYETFIEQVQLGKGVRNNGPIIKDMLGYNEDGEYYEYDLDKCAEELEMAWDGQLPETGFRVQVAFNTGNTTRQTIAAILQASLGSINPDYQVEIIGLPWPTLLRSFRAKQLPVAISGWGEDIHDPHNWVQPFTVGVYAGRQNLPQELVDQFTALVNEGVSAGTPEEREAAYFELQQLHHDEAPQITLSQATNFRVEQRWVDDWFYRVGQSNTNTGGYFYAYNIADGME
jgi:peptide/nickel transport system substrate-binding protein